MGVAEARPLPNPVRMCDICKSFPGVSRLIENESACDACLSRLELRLRNGACQCGRQNTTMRNCGTPCCAVCITLEQCRVCSYMCSLCKKIRIAENSNICPSHRFCNNCFDIERLSKRCDICTNTIEEIKCYNCRKFNILQRFCGKKTHGICDNCLEEVNSKCSACQTCTGCYNLVSDFQLQECGHNLCQSCIRDNNICMPCKVFCFICSNPTIQTRKLSCGNHSICINCKETSRNLCRVCERCANCNELKECILVACGHSLCETCGINATECIDCIRKQGLKECTNCKTNQLEWRNYDCGHIICKNCFESYECIKYKYNNYIEPIRTCETCYKDAIVKCLCNKTFCSDHCQSHGLMHGNHMLSHLYSFYDVNDPHQSYAKQKILKTIDQKLKEFNELSLTISRFGYEAIQKINESISKSLESLKSNINNLLKVKNKLITDNFITETHSKKLLNLMKPYNLTHQKKIIKCVDKICNCYDNLIADSYEDKFFLYFSSIQKQLISISLETCRSEAIKFNGVHIGNRNQVARYDNAYYFFNGGFDQGKIKDSCLIDPMKKKIIPLEKCFISLVEGACVIIHPNIYIFAGDSIKALMYQIEDKL